jgi:Holliday junction resolvase RusA-like endonuclease
MDMWVSNQPTLPELLTCPLHCDIEFVVKRPGNPANPYPIGDIDNYLKAIWDSLQGRAFFKDDKQIESVNAVKRYTVDNEEVPHIAIAFKEIEHGYD